MLLPGDSRILLAETRDYRPVAFSDFNSGSILDYPRIIRTRLCAFVRVDRKQSYNWRGFFRIGSGVSRYSLNERLDGDLPDCKLCNQRSRLAYSAYAAELPGVARNATRPISIKFRKAHERNCSLLFQTRRTRRPVEGVARPPLPCWVHDPWMSLRTGSL